MLCSLITGSGSLEEIRDAISSGADPNERNELGLSVVWIALRYGRFDVFSYLLEQGADPNTTHDLGYSLLTQCSRAEDDCFLLELIKYNPDPNVPDEFGRTALYYASRAGWADRIRILLELRANPNVSVQDYSPLRIAIKEKHYHVVPLLLEAGADVSKVINTSIFMYDKSFRELVLEPNIHLLSPERLQEYKNLRLKFLYQ